MKPRAGQKHWAVTPTHEGSQQHQKKMKKTVGDEDSEDMIGHDNSGKEGREGSAQEGDNEWAEKDARPDEGGKDSAETDEECEQAATDDDGAEKDAPINEQGQKDAQGHKQARGPLLCCSQRLKPKAITPGSTTASADAISIPG